MSAKEQLAAMKDLFVKEFDKMDNNANGSIHKNEYLYFQFENLRTNIIEAEGFDKPAQKTSTDIAEKNKEVKEVKDDEALAGGSSALQEMADFDFDLDFLGEPKDTAPLDVKDFLLDENKEDNTEDKTAETVSDTLADLPELDLSLSEEESLDNIIADMDKKENPTPEPTEPEKDPVAEEQRITALLESIKKTLPKKIDDITTWTDVTYKENTIAYIYQADVNTSSFSSKEMIALKSSIENEACVNAYYEMCPKIKPAFIDEGINVKIIYQDKTGMEINSCNFNDDTCK